jgi:phosphoribosylanthranilate isomerase
LARPTDAQTAEAAGASYVGAIFVPGSPREVSPEVASTLAESVTIPLIAVVADLRATEAARIARRAGAGGIQLHGAESPAVVRVLREEGDWELWKAVRVRSETDIVEASDRFGELVDLLLLDGWKAGLLGGTGTAFPWGALESVRRRIPGSLQIGVAGGLSAENVGEAVFRMDPDLVDVSSGVESSPGTKDPLQVRSFVESAQGAGRRVAGG